MKDQIKFQYATVLACTLLLCLALPCRANGFTEWLRGFLGTPGAGKDNVLEAQLKAAGFTYTETPSGDFLLGFEYVYLGQTQRRVVFVDSHLRELSLEKIRELWIRVESAGTRVTGEQAFDLLRRNERYKIGAWQVACKPPALVSESECAPVFQIEIPGDASTSYLKMAINTLVLAAQEVTNDWTPKGWMAMGASSEL